VSALAAAPCPRCGAAVDAGQEFCLTCGLRLPGQARLGRLPADIRALRLRVGGLALFALAGAAVAIVLAWQGPAEDRVTTATGGSVTAPTPAVEPISRLAVWPRTARGWTIVLASIPKAKGRDKAVAVAQQGRTRGLPRVGVLDSSRFASLQPGYWMTFTGRFQSEADATGSLRKARVAVKGARVVRVEP
jgi:hypothetical protein